MSADNYMLVDVDVTNDGYVVYNGSASSDDHPSKYSTGRHFNDLLKAIDYAHEEYSEYGVTLSEEVRKELTVVNMKKQENALTAFAWRESDKAVRTNDRDGWAFVGANAKEIVRIIATKGE